MLNTNYIFIFSDEMQSNVNECGKESCDINEIFIVSEVDNVSTQTCILGTIY